MNELHKTHNHHIKDAKNGFQGHNNLVYMQVRGKNQLLKEIDENQAIENKIMDNEAIHRNELTQELEGQEIEEHLNHNADLGRSLSKSTKRTLAGEETFIKIGYDEFKPRGVLNTKTRNAIIKSPRPESLSTEFGKNPWTKNRKQMPTAISMDGR